MKTPSNRTISFISLLATIISTFVFGCATVYLSVQQNSLSQTFHSFEVARTRADISILVNPPFNQNWTFVIDGAYLTVNGTLRNEGPREALIERIDLSVTYHFSDGDPYTITVGYSDLPKWCNLGNTTILEKGEKSFSIAMFIHTNIAVDTHTGQILGIGNSRSDNFTLSVTYFDGIGDLQSQQQFKT